MKKYYILLSIIKFISKGYTVESVKKNFIIKYKAVAGEQLSLKMEGVVDVPLFNMLALIYEMEGYTSWMPFCTEAKEVIFFLSNFIFEHYFSR